MRGRGNRPVKAGLALRACLWVTGISGVVGCAQISQPSGGPRDAAPPVPVYVDPPSGTRNWIPGTLRVTWDEYVEVKDARNQWLISPPVAKMPTFEIHGKTVLWDWSACDLLPDVTYQFQLGRSVVDFHEGNAVEGFRWMVATGATLDSGKIAARVLRLEGGSPVPGVRVMLAPWDIAPDSLNAGISPSYVGVTDAEGRVELDGLAWNRYRLYAVNDADGNYRWAAGEDLGLWPEPVEPQMGVVLDAEGDTLSPVYTIRLAPTPPVTEPFRWQSAVVEPAGWIRAAYTGSRDALAWEQARLLRGEQELAAEVWVSGDSVWWMPEPGEALDSLRLVAAGDTIVCRTRRVTAGKPNAEGSGEPRPLLGPSGKLEAASVRGIRFDAPIGAVDATLWLLRRDGELLTEGPTLTCRGGEVEVAVNEVPGARWELQALPGAWQGWDGKVHSDTVTWSWETRKLGEFSKLTVRLDHLRCPGLLELLDGQDRVLSSVYLEPAGSFTYHDWGRILPGKVQMRWREDSDEDGLPEGPDWSHWQLPERILRTEKPLDLLPDWEMEWIWDLEGSTGGSSGR